MKKVSTLIIGLSIASAVGITYVINSFKNFPDIFDFTEDEEDNDEF